MLRRFVTLLVGLLVGVLLAGTTTLRATAFTYDAPTASRSSAPAVGVADEMSDQASVAREGSASRSVGSRGASTTLVAGSVATNTVDDAVNVIPSSGKTYVGTPRGTVYDVPEGWTQRVADNGKGSVYQQPGSVGNTNSVRIMEPTPKYPDGYARVYNNQGNGQPIDVFGTPGPQPTTHIPETYVGPWPPWPK